MIFTKWHCNPNGRKIINSSTANYQIRRQEPYEPFLCALFQGDFGDRGPAGPKGDPGASGPAGPPGGIVSIIS